jgi:hypothetical protein
MLRCIYYVYVNVISTGFSTRFFDGDRLWRDGSRGRPAVGGDIGRPPLAAIWMRTSDALFQQAMALCLLDADFSEGVLYVQALLFQGLAMPGQHGQVLA